MAVVGATITLGSYVAGETHARAGSLTGASTTVGQGSGAKLISLNDVTSRHALNLRAARNTRHRPRTTTTVSSVTSTSAPATTTTTPAPTSTTTSLVTTTSVATALTNGTPSASSPSGMAPPSASALAGYRQSYVTDFPGTSVPSGWYPFTGTPGGDPGGQFAASHVVVGGGLMSVNTWKDPAFGNEWVTGGICNCGNPQTYGAYFVRSRVTGAGPTAVQLLWPLDNSWPPEIDFNETAGDVISTSATVHWGATNHIDQRKLSIDMTAWHTWGVIWTPTAITYTVDGRVWGTVTTASEIPNVAMTLDLQQQTWCASGWACPTAPQTMQIDWVAQYSPS